jgi:hypothetical protein
MANLRIGSAVVRDEAWVVGVFTGVDALRALADASRDGRQQETTVASAKLKELIADCDAFMPRYSRASGGRPPTMTIRGGRAAGESSTGRERCSGTER